MDKKSLIGIASFLLAVAFLLAVCFWAWKTELAPAPVLVKVQNKSVDSANSDDLPSGSIRYGNMVVFQEERDGINQMILKRKDREIVVDEGRSYPIGEEEGFSPEGGYFTYTAWSNEKGETIVYDLKQEKAVYSNPWPVRIEFTDDDENFAACGSESAHGWKEARVISIRRDMTIFDAMIPSDIKFPAIKCTYDRELKSVIFNVKEDKIPSENARQLKIKYFLKTGEQETVSVKPECGNANQFSQKGWWSDFRSKAEEVGYYNLADLPPLKPANQAKPARAVKKTRQKSFLLRDSARDAICRT